MLGLALAADQGGYAPSLWAPVALVAVGLVLAQLVVGGPSARRPPPIRAAIWGLGLFAAWSLLSVAWAADRSIALTGGARASFYAVALSLLVVAWPRSTARVILGLVAVGAGLTAAVTLARAAGPGGQSLFIQGRLSDPLGYANATADFWLLAVFPALGLAADAGLRTAVRSIALGIAGILLETSLLSQSRGAVLAFGLSTLALVALHPRRGPVLVALAALAAATTASSGALLRVRHAHSIGELGNSAAHATTVIALVGAILVAASVLWLLLVRRLPDRIRAAVTGPVLGNRLAAGLLAAGLLGWLVVAGNPITWTKDRWHDFKTTGYTTVESAATRFGGSLGSNRFDFYRVALDQFTGHPVAGIGADNFQIPYLQMRRSPEAPVYPHSLELGVLAQTGLVGSAAFLLFAAGLVVAIRRSLRVLGSARGPAVAALCGGLVWLVHSSVDWLWAFPGLALTALLLLATAARAEAGVEPTGGGGAAVELDAWGQARPRLATDGPRQPPTPVAGRTRARGRRPAARARTPGRPPGRVALGGAMSVMLAAVFIFVGTSSHFARSADGEAARDPAHARADFSRAAALDPFAAAPLVSEAILARRAGLVAEASRSLEQALARTDQSWFAHFEQGLLSAASGAAATARNQLARARRLNPREPVIAEAMGRIAAGRAVDPGALEAELAGEQSARLGRTG